MNSIIFVTIKKDDYIDEVIKLLKNLMVLQIRQNLNKWNLNLVY